LEKFVSSDNTAPLNCCWLHTP